MSESNTSIADNVLDVEKIRKDFPILSQMVREKPLIYFSLMVIVPAPAGLSGQITEW